MQVHTPTDRGRNSFVLGVVSLVLGVLVFPAFFLGIPAWVMGRRVLDDAGQGTVPPAEESLARAGKTMGAIASVLGVIGVTTALVVTLFVNGFLREHVVPMIQDMSGGTSGTASSAPTDVKSPASK